MKKFYIIILVFIIFSTLVANSLLAQEKALESDATPIEQQDLHENSDLKTS